MWVGLRGGLVIEGFLFVDGRYLVSSFLLNDACVFPFYPSYVG